MGGIVLLVLLGLIYFIPSIVGRNKRNFNAILVLNIFLGWTLVGWVIALVWAATKDAPIYPPYGPPIQQPTPPIPPPATSPTEPVKPIDKKYIFIGAGIIGALIIIWIISKSLPERTKETVFVTYKTSCNGCTVSYTDGYENIIEVKRVITGDWAKVVQMKEGDKAAIAASNGIYYDTVTVGIYINGKELDRDKVIGTAKFAKASSIVE